jgi:predicted RNA-binding protein with PIN domain
MDNTVITTIISTSGAVVVGLGGMWISTNQVGKRIDDLSKRIDRMEDSLSKRMARLEDDLARRMERLDDELKAFKEAVNGKLSMLDSELAKLMDKRG